MQLIKEAGAIFLIERPAYYTATSVADMLDSRQEVINHCSERWPWSGDFRQGIIPGHGEAVILFTRLNHDLEGSRRLSWHKPLQFSLYDETGYFSATISRYKRDYALWTTTPWVNRSALIRARFEKIDRVFGKDTSFEVVDILNLKSPSRDSLKNLPPALARLAAAAGIR